MVRQYLEHSITILTGKVSGYKPNRTGIDSISYFGYQNEYNLSEGFPLLTTKKININPIIHELIWFLKGDSNLRYLVQNDVHIWDGNAFQHYLRRQGLDKKIKIYSSEWKTELKEFVHRIKEDEDFAIQNGDMGEVYGAQWRHWKTSDGKEIDQLADVIDALRNKPQSRRIVLTAWNPEQVPNMALPPCHMISQFNVLEGKLDCHLYQRSCDMFLGVPFNIASYAMLTQILAQEAELVPGRFIHTFGDSHFYCGGGNRGKFYGNNLGNIKKRIKDAISNKSYLGVKDWIEKNAPAESPGLEGQDHVTGILEQLAREPKQLPKIEIAKKPFDKLTIDDFKLIGYDPHPAIKRAMAV